MAICKRNGKTRYNSWDEAHASLTKITTIPGDNAKPCRVYQCPHCDGFHLTSHEWTPTAKPIRLVHAKEFKQYIS